MTRPESHLPLESNEQFYIDVVVTEQDIALARPHHSATIPLAGQCPIAFALNRAYPEVGEWHVGSSSVVAFHGRKTLELPLPREAQQYVLLYDAIGDAPPFRFQIDPLKPLKIRFQIDPLKPQKKG